ncbi:hypothetical protein SAMN05216263_114121 [Metapseudomonas otitidis]|nr:hypothetical protein SAMN05216263_114121 [Pseudomonas otitidis]
MMQNAQLGLAVSAIIVAFGLVLFYFDHLRGPRRQRDEEDPGH